MVGHPPTALRITGLAKRLPNGRSLFAGLNLEVAPGTFVAITGESGVGKSTLLNLVAGLDRPDAGQILVADEAVNCDDEAAVSALRRNRIGFVFQAFHLLPHLSLVRNVALPLVLQRRSPQEALVTAEAGLAAVGLAGRGADYPAILSGGELQRVAIARALVHQPPLILADEPTGNLDPDTAARVMAVFVDQARRTGAAVVMVTHSDLVAGAADRRLHLTPGGFAP